MSHGKNSAPDRGSFPLDHFEECREIADRYNECLKIHEMMPKRCRKHQKDYMECRMSKGLMKQEPLEKLGFTKETEWETEEQERAAIMKRINELKAKAISKVAPRVYPEHYPPKDAQKSE